MVKEKITRTLHDSSVISLLCAQYSLPPPTRFVSLAGGFSGTNYRCDFQHQPSICLKICHGYERIFVEAQAKVQHHLFQHQYKMACFAMTLNATSQCSTFSFATQDPTTGDPVIVLTFVNGRAADALLEEKLVSVDVVFQGMGASLGELHTVPVCDQDQLRTYQDGGACDVYKQMMKIELKRMEISIHTKNHPFLTFYIPRRQALEDAMCKAEHLNLTRGVIHGDPFADNVMLDPTTGQVSAWVDWEDATTGPILFDVAVAIIGTCFPEGSSKLDPLRLKRLMAGYTRVRPLPKEEVELLVEFCRLALLCNCCWRFTNFHIAHREIIDCRNRYVELRDRILELERPDTQQSIVKIFSKNSNGHYVVAEINDKEFSWFRIVVGTIVLFSFVW